MDILHHSVIGLIGFNVAVSVEETMLGLFFLLGSIFPDLDAFFVLFGKRFYLKNHQGISHSLLLAPIYALVFVGISLFWLEFSLMNYFGFILGFWIHSLLDYSNTYGITLFYPLSSKRYVLDSVFFVDAFLLFLTFSMYFFNYSLWIYLLVYVAYVFMKIWMHKKVELKLDAHYAIPSALNPFEFYVYKKEENNIIVYLYNVLSSTQKDYRSIENQEHHYKALTDKSKLFEEMKQVTKALHIVETKQEGKQTILVAQDLAVRNFGAKFGTTTLTFENGELINETANI